MIDPLMCGWGQGGRVRGRRENGGNGEWQGPDMVHYTCTNRIKDNHKGQGCRKNRCVHRARLMQQSQAPSLIRAVMHRAYLSEREPTFDRTCYTHTLYTHTSDTTQVSTKVEMEGEREEMT